jgi:hypothetical protein
MPVKTGLAAPVIAGIAVGAGLILAFGFLYQPPAASGRVWATTDPVQCLGNPWEVDWLKSNKEYPRDDGQTKAIIKDYYSRQGVTVFDVQYVDSPPGTVVCLACSCPAGYTLYIQIDGNSVEKMEALGYKVSEGPP